MTFIEQLNQYWAILLFLGSVISAAAYFKFQISDVEKEMIKLEARVAGVETTAQNNNHELRATLSVFQNTLTEVVTTLKFIQADMKDLKDKT